MSSESWDCNHVSASMCTIKEAACKIFINRSHCQCVVFWGRGKIGLEQSWTVFQQLPFKSEGEKKKTVYIFQGRPLHRAGPSVSYTIS